MARNRILVLLPMFVFVAATVGRIEAGNCNCKQWMGCGYGPGYNAPSRQQCGNGVNNNWQRGCCEIPSNWRLHVWDGYRGDPYDYQKSLIGAQPDYIHMPHSGVYVNGPGYGSGYGPGNGSAGRCVNCQNGSGSSMYSTSAPPATPDANYSQPIMRSGRASTADKLLR